MSVKNFVPQLWSARLLANLDKSHVFANIVNRDYEGEIKAHGDTVKINQMGDVTIGDYDGTDIDGAEDLTSTQQELKIDQAKYFNFQVDDVDQAQANITLMDKGMARASHALAEEVDKKIASLHNTAGVGTIGSTDTPIELEKSNIYEQIVEMGVKLDEQNVSRHGRFVVIPAFAYGLLLQAPEFVKASDLGDSVVTNGFVGQVAGFNVYMSNNVAQATGGKFKIMGGTTDAISFAEQIVSVEAYRPEARFADAVKGLHVYGVKVVEPKALVVLTATKK